MVSRMTSRRWSHWRPVTSRSLSPAGQTSTMPKRVAASDIHALRRDVHPADVVGVVVADQLGAVVVHPVGIRLAEAGPFVAGALRVAFEVDELVVDLDAAGAGAAFELGFAETGGHAC